MAVLAAGQGFKIGWIRFLRLVPLKEGSVTRVRVKNLLQRSELIGFIGWIRFRRLELLDSGLGSWFRYKERCPNSGGWIRFAAAADMLHRRILFAAGG